MMKAKDANLVGKIAAAIIVLTAWIGGQFFKAPFPIDDAIKAAGAIALIFAGIDLNLIAEKFSRPGQK